MIEYKAYMLKSGYDEELIDDHGSRVRIPLGPNVFFTSPGAKRIGCHHLLGD